MGAQCGKEPCNGAARFGEAGAEEMWKDEPRADIDAPPISGRSSRCQIAEPASVVQVSKDHIDRKSSVSTSDAGSFASPKELDDSDSLRSRGRDAEREKFRSNEQWRRATVRAQSQPPPAMKDARIFSSMPANAVSSLAKERWEKTGRRVNTAVRLTKLLRASSTDVPPLKCAISLEMLNEFAKSAKDSMGSEYEKASFREVVKAIILPQCDHSGRAYARVMNREAPRAAHVFVCHSWDTSFRYTVDSINTAFQHWPRKPNLWISGFALMQSARRIPLSRPMDAPFAAVLREAHSIMVVQSPEVDLTSRLWPVWEVFLAQKYGLPEKKGGIMFAGQPAQTQVQVDAAKALTSNESDRAAIMAAIEELGGADMVNSAVAKVLARRQESDSAR
mmetsp:Transcript_80686/g.168272  ORF Transcript_80686/g.168272 Transcript_80686/m.168272 type:complete len:391 (-) Transcript_80686:532-1704(-)